MFNINELDRHMSFLANEAATLRKRSEGWAQTKADQLDRIWNVLRQVRQQQQMTGLSGSRID